MGWFTKKEQTQEQKMGDLKSEVDKLPASLRSVLKENEPQLSALGDVNPLAKAKSGSIGDIANQLSANNQLNGQEEAKNSKPVYGGQYSAQASSLEKAAQAAKQLDKSPRAAEYIEMAQKEEETRQIQANKDIERYKLEIKKAEGEKIRIQGDEDRKSLQMKAKIDRENSDYQHKLAIDRDRERMDVEKRLHMEKLQNDEQSVQKQEKLRRETIEYEMNLRKHADIAKAEAEARAKAVIDRENHDIKMKEIRLESELKGKTTVEVTKKWIDGVGNFLSANFSTPQAAATSIMIAGALGMCLYTAKKGVEVTGNVVQKKLMQPVLVRDTSRASGAKRLVTPIISRLPFMKNAGGVSDFSKIILPPSVRSEILDIAIGAQEAIKHQGTLRNVLLFGPPGTGKTLFARELAKHSNMDYAIVSGGDVAPLGADAVTEVHKLWDWGESQKNGMILFIDEAEAFLQKRDDKHGKMSEEMRACINAFLMKSGTESKKIMIVLATNQPEQLDWAVIDRFDRNIEFPLPAHDERKDLLSLYYDSNILDGVCAPKKGGMFSNSSTRPLTIDDNLMENFEDSIVDDLAQKTEGFSGRQLNKLVTAWEQSMYQSEEGMLTEEMINKSIGEAKNDMERRKNIETITRRGTN